MGEAAALKAEVLKAAALKAAPAAAVQVAPMRSGHPHWQGPAGARVAIAVRLRRSSIPLACDAFPMPGFASHGTPGTWHRVDLTTHPAQPT